MLVISRRKEERVFIGEDIAVSILGISGGQVRLGIEAPKDVKILREELVDAEPSGDLDE